MDIKQYALQFARWHSIWERKTAPIFYKALAQSVSKVLVTLDEKDLLATPWIAAYNKAYGLIGVVAAQREYLQMRYNNPTKADGDIVSFLNEQWRLLMERYGNEVAFDFVTELNETTIGQIRKALAQAGATSATNTETAKLIREFTLGDIGKKRSLLIARTETTTIANKAKLVGAESYFKEIGDTKGYKMWITRMDGKERHDHAAVNETAVLFNNSFEVGGFAAQTPGDPKLPAKERVRCRCTFVTLSEAGYRRRFGK